MEYFFYCRDRANTATLREELAEAHWAFMDRYAAAMVARGPTLNADETMATGSMHIVDLPDVAAAQVFAFAEPNYRAGI
ncbi:MAG TPA: YciI family protein [Ktedonobacterales bacterium]|nr:YciI family protein [Ktedonobacterales bacterium]